ncbi:MAG TPA: transglycosylase SLT domain-containing protein [Oxalicibacterium sp.]|uniref:lytic transglycosylase domain-containing protein n=1 Tax=Oxalicibacterium sp. TaxID=2766525 RepID=UPI002BE9A3CA|nr:transglycosylase SLT domain-containing protein [Oxalicibacterium sp.]HWU99043.1 transglycosylase SLT domain-containing protein [Oxalicibacterium sp.]
MFSKTFFARFVFAAASATLLLPGLSQNAHAQKRPTSFASDDDAFLALRDASRRGDTARVDEIAARLGNYPIPSYVDYYRLQPRIKDASAAEIQAFLTRYDGSAIADRLRNDWLLELGKRRDWTTFDVQYPLFQLNDDTQLKCYALMSKALKGGNVAEEARLLLNTPKNYGEGCVALIGMLVENGQFDDDDLWAQVRLASDTGNTDFVRRLVPFTGIDDDSLVKAMDKPMSVVARGPGFRRVKHEVFIVALGRVARNDPLQAASVMESKDGQRLNLKQQALAWAQIAQHASKKLMPEADDYWHKAGNAPLSLEAHEWKVRIALRAGDWKLVKKGIEAMPPSLRSDPTWTYWMARAFREEGQKEKADVLLQSIAAQTGFYGQLALEDLGRSITIPPRAAPVTEAEVAPMTTNEGFRRAFKFFDLGLRFEGYREWNWELRRMNERQHLAAAEFARRNSVLDRMVNTSDRTKIEVDFDQRFPTPYRNVMQDATQKLGLEMAWVYGLIRQESRFVMDARSHVGASGLMQLMPATARHVAKKIGFDDFAHSRVNEIETNILLGTNYLNMVLNDLDGSQTMATAAYNAGPGRPRAWRSTLTRPVEGAIFAETIPFTETRDYVKKVLSNATYYAAMFENKPQSLKQRLGMVGPAAYVPSALP